MQPIFIGGSSRSGTTMLGAMLGAHTRCICTPESQFKTDVFTALHLEPSNTFDTKKALSFIESNVRFKLWDIDHKADNNPTGLNEIMTSLVSSFADKEGRPNADIWIDHTPSNLQHAAILKKVFPAVKMIHIVRDGRGVGASIMPLDWGPNTAAMAARWWAENMGYGLAAESYLGSDSVIRVKYEDLVAEPTPTLKKLCSFIGIDFEPSMIEAGGFKVHEYSTSQHNLVGKAPDIKRMNAWRDKLTSREIEIFESITGELLTHLGYETIYGIKARGLTEYEKITTILSEVFSYIRNRFRLRRRKKLIND